MIAAIIFDWHGVLDETKLENLVQSLSTLSGKPFEECKAIMKTFERAYAEGIVPPSSFWQNIQNKFQLTPEKVEEAKKSILVVKKYLPLWEKLPELSAAYMLAILSDCPQEKADLIRASTDLSAFSQIHFSCEKHLLKDSDKFFLRLAQDLQSDPRQCLYVDDTERHIVSAKRLGFQTCHFTSIDDLTKSLSRK